MADSLGAIVISITARGERPNFDVCVVEDHQGGAVILLRQMRAGDRGNHAYRLLDSWL
jgi:hypothetical protein